MSQRGLQRDKAPATPVAEDSSVNTFNLMNALLDEHAKLLREIRDIERLKIPKGKTFPMSFTLRVDSNKVVYIDFLDDSDTRGVPADAYANPPYEKLRTLLILVDTGGSDINFSTNDAPLQSAGRGGTIKTGSSVSVEFDFPVIESLTIALADGATLDTTVRIIGTT
jgi:hypothetical protein